MPANEPTRPTSSDLSDRVRSLRLGDRTAAAPPRSRLVPWIICLVLLLTCVALAFRAYRVGSLTPEEIEALTSGSTTKASGEDVVQATTSTASVGEVVLQAKGYIIPISTINVSPKIGGPLKWINKELEEGALFKKGDRLARLEDDEYKADYESALYAWRAAEQRYEDIKKTQPDELQQAEAELKEARQTTQQLKLETDRNKRLTVGRSLTEREMEQARYSYESSAARVERLETAVRMLREGRLARRLNTAEFEMRQAKASHDKMKYRYDNVDILAPVTGIILTKKAEEGDFITPAAATAAISANLCAMADLTQLEVDLKIQERDVAVIKKGMQCVIMPEAYQNDKEFLAIHPYGYEGYVSRLMPVADRAQGAIPVRVKVLGVTEAEAGRFLRPDMGVLVSFKRPQEKKAGDKKDPDSAKEGRK